MNAENCTQMNQAVHADTENNSPPEGRPCVPFCQVHHEPHSPHLWSYTVGLSATYSHSDTYFYKQASGSSKLQVPCLSTAEDGKPWVLVFLCFHIFLLCIVNNGTVQLQKACSYYFAFLYMQ